SEEHSLNFFDVQIPVSPYDEEGDTSNVEGNYRVTYDDYATVENEVASVATQIEENVTSENHNGEGHSNNMGTSPGLRRSTRKKVMPARFNDFVVNCNTPKLGRNGIWVGVVLHRSIIQDIYKNDH
ncbi:hypothetical protein Tco_0114804, partial [Tanacetum coccineum]